mgnify:CR=1 FL=1
MTVFSRRHMVTRVLPVSGISSFYWLSAFVSQPR